MTLPFDSLLAQSLSRRTLLKLFGVSTVGGALGYSRLAKPQPSVYDRDTLTLPTKLEQPLDVAVVGGGLAGLAAAYQLSQRGFRVTLLERSPQLGGKIASWPIEVNGESLHMEHGFHGFFPQYYNLWSLVDELSIPENFVSLPTYTVAYKDGYAPEVFRPSSSAFPWNIVDLAIWSPNRLQWGINLAKLSHLQVFKEITGFHPVKSYEHLDHISVAEWIEKGFPSGLYDLYFLPFAKSSLNAPDVLSAGELMQFFHFYFFGNPEGLAFRGTRQDMGRSLVDPIAAGIVANGGRVITESTITGLDWEDGQISAIRYQQGSPLGSAPFWVDRNPLLSTETCEYFGAGDAVYALSEDRKTALSLTCTHQGCTVQLQADGQYHCPCHGACFARDGALQAGPAQRSLPRYKVLQRQGEQVQLVAVASTSGSRSGGEPSVADQEQVLRADYYVMAADVVGMRNLFSRCNGSVDECVQQQVFDLAVADPFAVARFWLDRDFTWEHSDFTSLSGYRLTDSITLYHHIQDDYKAWAARNGGSVVELHAYCYKEKEFPTQDALLATFEAELYEVVPDLKGATILHRQLVNQKNFSGFPPNSYADRPSTKTGVANLFFAGDWVKMPFPCGLMERAVSSGLLAANAICEQEALQKRPLLTVNPSGVLSPLSAI